MIRNEDIMDNKPLVTYAGDNNLFSSIETSLVNGIPQDSIEWKRSYGRVVKAVCVEASFIPFSKEVLLKSNPTWSIIHQPILHTYWTDCPDVETYKTTVKDEIEQWLKLLQTRNIQDWMIVLVENYDIRKSNKLIPRTTVLDKLRNDFATKNGDRFLSVINPIKSEIKSAESWRGLLIRIRHLMLTGYNRSIMKFEEYIREQRERRNENGWNFCQYFLLQEELAFVFEMLGLYEDALVQYDELDALFTQFVLNSHISNGPAWLASFQRPLQAWKGIHLTHTVCQQERDLIATCEASLLEFRSYLFQRQCAMLLLTCKPWEIAQRSLPFLHNTVRELDLLDLAESAPEGSSACWVFLCCLEVLHTCERFNNTGHVEQYSLYTADLWAYASDKLKTLGKLCGLMPGCNPTSAQLHMVVNLSAGMGDCPGTKALPSPTDKLKEALSSNDAFQRHYLELAELAMGTYKHIGRIRSARLIGRDIARFSSELGQMNKAIVFLNDALRAFSDEGWRTLVVQTQLELAACYKKMDDLERYIKISAAIASSQELEILVRHFYFEEMTKSLKTITKHDNQEKEDILSELTDVFKIVSLRLLLPENCIVMQDNIVEVELKLDSRLPKEIHAKNIAISLEFKKGVEVTKKSQKPQKSKSPIANGDVSDDSSLNCDTKRLRNAITAEDMKQQNILVSQIKMSSQLDYRQDGALGCASAACHTTRTLRRSSSTKNRKTSDTYRQDFSISLTSANNSLKPGLNIIKLSIKATRVGVLKLGQLSVATNGLEFLSGSLKPSLSFEVITESAAAILDKVDYDLLAGFPQKMILTVKSGSFRIAENSFVVMKMSKGLMMKCVSNDTEEFAKEFKIPLTITEPFQSTKFDLMVLADLPPRKDDKSVEHKVIMQCPWSRKETTVPLHFPPPFLSVCRLHTSQTRKFVQISVRGLNSQKVLLKCPKLKCNIEGLLLRDLNPGEDQMLVITNGITASFMWELEIEPLQEHQAIFKSEFSIQYAAAPELLNSDKICSGIEPIPNFTEYQCPFELKDYTTVYIVKCKVEPSVGSEFCRTKSMCHLQLSVTRCQNKGINDSIMYEVLADQTMWAVCGRTAGVISIEDCKKQTVTLEVIPLTAGFLPLPLVRLSKYITAEQRSGDKTDNRKQEISSNSHPKLEPFSQGQVYNCSKAQQVHVLGNNPDGN